MSEELRSSISSIYSFSFSSFLPLHLSFFSVPAFSSHLHFSLSAFQLFRICLRPCQLGLRQVYPSSLALTPRSAFSSHLPFQRFSVSAFQRFSVSAFSSAPLPRHHADHRPNQGQGAHRVAPQIAQRSHQTRCRQNRNADATQVRLTICVLPNETNRLHRDNNPLFLPFDSDGTRNGGHAKLDPFVVE